MKRTRFAVPPRARWLAPLLGAAMLAATGGSACATELLTFQVEVDTLAAASGCGFPMTRHDRGTLVFVDRFVDGDLVLENAIFTHWTITFTNLDNGKSIDVRRAYLEQYVLLDDGAFRTMSAGMVSSLKVPGQGLVATNVGLIQVVFDSSEVPLSILVAGPHDGRINAYVCPGLA